MNRFGVLNLFVAIGLIASVTDAIDCNSKPDFSSTSECCPHDDFSSNAIVESCKQYLEEGSDGQGPAPGGHGGKHKGKHHNNCHGECIMNATGLVNFETMDFDEAKAKKFLDEKLSGSPDIIPVALDAMKKCVERGKEMHAKHANDPKPSPPPGQCKPCAQMFLHCVKMEVTINCPTSVWKNDDTCNNIREFMTECKGKHGPPK